MEINDFLRNYYLHDSLLESIDYNKSEKTLVLSIDFCYWTQQGYKDDEPENGMIKVIFRDVANFFGYYAPNSDSILSAEITEGNSLKLTTESDDSCIHTLLIEALSVEISK